MFGDVLKKLREDSNLSQEELAKIIGVSKSTIGMYELNQRMPKTDAILKSIASYFSVSLDYLLGFTNAIQPSEGAKLVPVLGTVAAGIPIDAIENVIDYEEITNDMALQGEHFALKVKGSSMEPRFNEGDVVIVRQQSDVDNGDIAIVLVNGYEATIKKIRKREDGIELIPFNHSYDVMFYTNEEIECLPVSIIGKVVELRAKF